MSRPRSPAPSQPSVPPPHPSSTPAAPSDQPSNLASLALLLHNTTLERDEALKQVASFKRRLESAENILNKLAAPPSNSPGSSSGTPTATTATANPEEPILNPQAALALLNETRERLDAANNAIAESHHRLRSIQMQWEEYDKWHADWVYKGTQSHLAMAADLRVICGTVNPNGVSFASLPAQQFQMRPSASDPGTSSRRPRTTDSEGERATKRHRADTYQRPTDTILQPTNIHRGSTITGRLPPPPSTYTPAHKPRTQIQTAQLDPTPKPPNHVSAISPQPGFAQPAPVPNHHELRDANHDDTRDDGSDDGNSIDEMILEASSSALPPQSSTGSTPISRRPHANSSVSTSHPPPSASSSSSQSMLTQFSQSGNPIFNNTLIAPVKKQRESISIPGASSSSTAVFSQNPDAAPPARIQPISPPQTFPATNAEGQRTCRQCGMAGRYKDGRCVEKWGPGPMGPGTVCDRCRKKTKRVERRLAVDAATHGITVPPLTANNMQVPYRREGSQARTPGGLMIEPAGPETYFKAVERHSLSPHPTNQPRPRHSLSPPHALLPNTPTISEATIPASNGNGNGHKKNNHHSSANNFVNSSTPIYPSSSGGASDTHLHPAGRERERDKDRGDRASGTGPPRRTGSRQSVHGGGASRPSGSSTSKRDQDEDAQAEDDDSADTSRPHPSTTNHTNGTGTTNNASLAGGRKDADIDIDIGDEDEDMDAEGEPEKEDDFELDRVLEDAVAGNSSSNSYINSHASKTGGGYQNGTGNGNSVGNGHSRGGGGIVGYTFDDDDDADGDAEAEVDGEGEGEGDTGPDMDMSMAMIDTEMLALEEDISPALKASLRERDKNKVFVKSEGFY
ncbi:hypothetical protein SISNIDRAFT_457501 [Sistotremastrum niveocremeum HHB9708]|uniref:Uncharacterized protein n=1 Tax=Sistotremastrum niveocremeum HHB9708 TaxID=1314777 RepID=A0A164RL18_9AGAM|nr:hypothetical protein SISNIDRAFT_457501 [Sistotremastrum niveocremeum HHB9708]